MNVRMLQCRLLKAFLAVFPAPYLLGAVLQSCLGRLLRSKGGAAFWTFFLSLPSDLDTCSFGSSFGYLAREKDPAGFFLAPVPAALSHSIAAAGSAESPVAARFVGCPVSRH